MSAEGNVSFIWGIADDVLLDAFLFANVPDMKGFLEELQADLSRYQRDVQAQREKMALLPPQPPRSSDPPPILTAVAAGRQKG
jgi:hypothetical protein